MPDYSFLAQGGGFKPSELLNMVSSVKHIQAQDIENERQQKLLDEQNHIRDMAKNGFSEYLNENQQYDWPKLSADVLKGAPTIGAEHISGLYNADQNNIAAKQALSGFNQQQRTFIAQEVLATGGTPEEQYSAIEKRFSGNPDAAPIWKAASNRFSSLLQSPSMTPEAKVKAWNDLKNQFGQAILSVPDQNAIRQPQGPTFNNGQTQVMYNANPMAQINGQPVPQNQPVIGVQNQITPSEQHQVGGTGINGLPFQFERGPNGEFIQVKPVPVQGQPQIGPMFPGPGETPETAHNLYGARDTAAQAAQSVPREHYNNESILNLLDAVEKNGDLSPTGSNAMLIKRVGNIFGNPGVLTDKAALVDTLNHYISQNTAALNAEMGTHTNLEIQNNEIQSGNTQMAAKALKRAVSDLDALAAGKQVYAEGFNKAAQKGPQAMREFITKWPEAFSVEAMRLYRLSKTSPKDAAAFVEEMGGQNSERMKEIERSYNAMKAMSGQ